MTDTNNDIAKDTATRVMDAAKAAIEELVTELELKGEMRSTMVKTLERYAGFFLKQMFEAGVIPLSTEKISEMLAGSSISAVELFQEHLLFRLEEAKKQ